MKERGGNKKSSYINQGRLRQSSSNEETQNVSILTHEMSKSHYEAAV